MWSWPGYSNELSKRRAMHMQVSLKWTNILLCCLEKRESGTAACSHERCAVFASHGLPDNGWINDGSSYVHSVYLHLAQSVCLGRPFQPFTARDASVIEKKENKKWQYPPKLATLILFVKFDFYRLVKSIQFPFKWYQDYAYANCLQV